MGLLGEIYSAGDSAKRKLKGLLSDPLGELGLLGARAAEDMQTFLDTGAKAYPMLDPRLKPRLDTPQGREMVVDQNAARRQFGDMAGNMGMAAATVWHGSPHKFDRFDSSKIGTGEGAQAYGHGLYLAESDDVARRYRDTLTNFRPDHIEAKLIEAGVSPEMANTYAQFSAQKQGGARAFDDFAKALGEKSPSPYVEKFRQKLRDELPKARAASDAIHGSLYKVDLPDEAIAKMLDWDKPLSQQVPEVQRAIMNLPNAHKLSPEMTGAQFLESMHLVPGANTDKKAASDALKKLGIPGIRYLDGGSRGAGTGTRNYVVFPGNEGLLTILERNGVAP